MATFLSCIGLCFVRFLFLSLGCCGLVLNTSATDCKDVSEMTYNDPAHSLTVFSLIPV